MIDVTIGQYLPGDSLIHKADPRVKIIDYFGEEPKIIASMGKDVSTNYESGLLELYKKIRPGEPLTVESAESLISAMFFDPRRYDLAKVGRYKFNKKLAFKNRLRGQVLAEDVIDPSTGEVLAEAGTQLTREKAEEILSLVEE